MLTDALRIGLSRKTLDLICKFNGWNYTGFTDATTYQLTRLHNFGEVLVLFDVENKLLNWRQIG